MSFWVYIVASQPGGTLNLKAKIHMRLDGIKSIRRQNADRLWRLISKYTDLN